MRKHPILFMIVILLLLAMACNFGGGDDEEAADAGDAAADSAEELAGATADAKELESEESAEAEAESEPDATPSLAPTPTEAPTEVPTEEPTAEPTEAPMEGGSGGGSSDSGSGGDSGSSDSGSSGSSSGSSGSAVAGDPGAGVWGESATGKQTACDHPYFPMRIGSKWTFNNGADTMIWEITDVQGDLDNATAQMTNTAGDLLLEYQWNCSAEDGLVSFDFATLGLQDFGTDVTMENALLEGNFMPDASEMVPGYSWNLLFSGMLNFTQAAGDQTIEVNADLISDQTFTVVGDDPVSVGDQTFDGIQVEESNTISIVINMMGSEVPQEISIGSLMQLGYGVGVVRQDYDSDFGSETQQLVEFYIP